MFREFWHGAVDIIYDIKYRYFIINMIFISLIVSREEPSKGENQ